MYALRRTFISFIIFCLLGLAVTIAGHLIGSLLGLLLGPDHVGVVTWETTTWQGLGVLASFIFALGYLISGFVSRGRERPSDERPWRLVWILVGVNFIVFLADFSLQLVHISRVKDYIVFFYTPKELAEKHIPAGKRIRLGGLVAEGSLKRGPDASVEFAITDSVRTIPVSYTGILPDLFREGQGVVAEGILDASGRFRVDTVLTKHDEAYMPPEVAKALKAQGLWKGASKKAAPGDTAKQ